jgi:hypothetical protein
VFAFVIDKQCWFYCTAFETEFFKDLFEKEVPFSSDGFVTLESIEYLKDVLSGG